MSYQVLARKWRPRLFTDMVGQGHVLKALTNALDQDRLHHAYLFAGTRGIGKTTLARIFAKCLNCEQGVSATPCDQCTACVGINESRFIDLIEVDAASRARVEETRELMDNVQYAPAGGRYKVYLIDEIHMFSGHSFNALLKTLEEPPPHVKFLLATTEPKKLPVTVLSRCLQFNLRHLTASQIGEQLVKILQNEAVEHDHPSVELIARSARGSMRDALSLLDQAISHGAGKLEEGQVRDLLGTVNSGDLTDLITALVKHDGALILAAVDHIAAHNPDYDTVLAELLSLLQKAAMAQVLSGEARELVADNALIKQLADQVNKEEIQLYYQIGLTGRNDLSISPDPRAGFEMILIRMLAFQPARANMFPPAPEAEEPAPETAAIASPPAPLYDSGKRPESPPATADHQGSAWKDIIARMALTGLTRELADNCILKSHTANKIELVISTTRQYLLNDQQKSRLEAAIKTQCGEHLKVTINPVEEINAESPAQANVREQDEKKRAAIASLQQDQNVKAIVDVFDGRLDPDSVNID